MEQKRLALIIPPHSARGYRDVGMKSSLPHIGVAYLAANLDRNRLDIRIIDCPAEHISLNKLASMMAEFQPHYAGFTAMTLQIGEAHTAAKAVKRNVPGVVNIVGGYHVSAIPIETLDRYPEFDYGVYGEGEVTTQLLLDAIDAGPDPDVLKKIDGICYRWNGVTRVTKERAFIHDLNALKHPAYELMPMESYVGFYNMFMKPCPTVPISTGRGCPFKCIFCFKATGDHYRTRSIPSVIDEMERDIKDFGVKEFVVTDESFMLHRDRVFELCDTMMEKGLSKKVGWICQSRVDHTEPEMLARMKKAGCRVISYGIESGNPQILKNIKKGITLERALQAVKWTNEAGILTDTNFIIGHPGDTRETINQTINFSVKLDPNMASFALLVPFPGTEVSRMANNKEGGLKLISNDYARFGKQVGGAMELEDIPRSELEQFHRKAYIRFYIRPSKIKNLFRVVDVKMMMLMAWHTFVTKLGLRRPSGGES